MANAIKVRKKEIEKTITDEEIFTSEKFKSRMQNIVNSILYKQFRQPKVSFEHDPKSSCTAYTDGTKTHINTANGVIQYYTKRESRILTIIGILSHECAHILYLQFKEENAIMNSLKQNGELFGEIMPEDKIEEKYIKEIEEALNNENYRPIFCNIYHQLSNIFSDVHDERKITDDYHGLVEQALIYSTESLRGQSESVETLTEAIKNKQADELSVMFSLILQQARFGSVVIENESKLKSNELLDNIINIAPEIEKGTTTDDLNEKFSAINKCLLVLWKYIREMLNDNQQNGQNGNQSNDSDNSQSNQQQSTQNVMNSLNQGVKNAVGNASAIPQNRTNAPQKKGDNKSAGKVMSAEEAENIVKNIAKSIVSEQANEKAKREAENTLKSDDLQIINSADMTSSHKGIPYSVERDLEVDNSDRIEYQKQMKELGPISKKLQNKMKFILDDMKQGCKLTRRQFGRKIESRDTFRIDSKFFSNTKLPQDLPDMAIMVLIDESGSMSGSRIEAARKAAYLLYDFASGLNIPICICGHSNNYGVNFQQYTSFENISNNDKYRLNHIKSKNASNRDGMAIIFADELLVKRPEEVKLMFIISDGQPNADNYGGNSAKEDIRSIVSKYKKKGIQTFAAAIGDDRERIREIYGSGYLDITDLSQLPKTLVNMVKKRLI